MTQDLRVIVAGGGTTGLRTAQLLSSRGHDVVIIEQDPLRWEQLEDEWIATVIAGDAARPEVLRQAQPEKSDVVAALTDHETTNFAVCMAAQRMADIRTVMRVEDTPDELYEQYVDGIVFPAELGARVAANEIVGTGVRSIEAIPDKLEILELEVGENAPVAGKTLAQVKFPHGVLIIADEDGERIGGPETVLEPGHRYLVAIEADVADEVMQLLRG